MKKFYRIFLALVLSLSLLTGSIGLPVFAEGSETDVTESIPAPEGAPEGMPDGTPAGSAQGTQEGAPDGQSDADGNINICVHLKGRDSEDHRDGANVNTKNTNTAGNVSIDSEHEGEYNVTIKEDITAGENALTIRNNNAEINVDVQGSITSNGGTGIAVNNVGDLEWVEAGTFDYVEDLPAGRSETQYGLIPNPTDDEMRFILDHRSTLNENTEQYNDDILYEYKTDLYTENPIPLHKDNDPGNPTVDHWSLPNDDGSAVAVSYPGENTDYTIYEVTGEEYKPETQLIYGRERKDYGNTDETNVTVDKDLIVEGESGDLTGISVRSDNKFNETNISIGGNVEVTSLDAGEEGGHTATGIIVDALEGDISINIAGDLVVEGGVSDTGIVLNRHTHEEFVPGGAEKVNPEDMNGFSLGDQIIDGKAVTVFETEKEDGTPLYYDAEGNVYESVTVANEGTTQVVIAGDVISDGNGVELNAGGEERTDLIIDGSVVVTGGTSVVIKNDDTVLGENLTMTVWELTADQDGDYVKREEFDETTDSRKLVADREAEKAIQYIIRIDDSQKNMIHTDGTTNYQGRDVAREGDIIVLKIDVPQGLMIDEVYGDQNKNKLIRDDAGNYFMIVPRGGGVLFSVKLMDYAEPEPEPQPEPMPKPDPEPKPVPKPDPRPEPQPEPQRAEAPGRKPAEIGVYVVNPLFSATDFTGNVQLNCFRGGTFVARFRDGRSYTGRIVIRKEDGRLCFIGQDSIEMPVGDDGALTFIVGADVYTFQFSAADLAVLRSCTK